MIQSNPKIVRTDIYWENTIYNPGGALFYTFSGSYVLPLCGSQVRCGDQQPLTHILPLLECAHWSWRLPEFGLQRLSGASDRYYNDSTAHRHLFIGSDTVGRGRNGW